ncbi:MAG TPA: putative toxin-antitoxin system toxin component, PIN family [Rhodospirillaceae bacterium]|nr:putative toxin-antitoxin system toxin component, PIN family [Rhodospirillaceae bacterium]
MKLVLDTDVIVAAMRSPKGASAALLLAADAGEVELLATVPLYIEYEAVCTRAEHILASGVTLEEVEQFLDGLADLISPVEPWFLWRPQLRDTGDELVLEAAINGRADSLVTFNRADYRPAATSFGMPILLPREALQALRNVRRSQ